MNPWHTTDIWTRIHTSTYRWFELDMESFLLICHWVFHVQETNIKDYHCQVLWILDFSFWDLAFLRDNPWVGKAVEDKRIRELVNRLSVLQELFKTIKKYSLQQKKSSCNVETLTMERSVNKKSIDRWPFHEKDNQFLGHCFLLISPRTGDHKDIEFKDQMSE